MNYIFWVLYLAPRDDQPGHEGQCSSPDCGATPVATKYESSGDAPMPMCAAHATEEGWNGEALFLNEAAQVACLEAFGEMCFYTVEYEDVQPGDTVTFFIIPAGAQANITEIALRITRIIDGTINGPTGSGHPPSRLFEAVVVESHATVFVPGEPAFGILFPNGTAAICEGDPTGGHTASRIETALEVRRAHPTADSEA